MTDPNTQGALRHGPLTSDMVPLLTAGSSVLVPNGPNVDGVMLAFLCVGNSPGYIRFRDDKSNEAHGPQGYFTYIGERGPDGWITAPEGGWTENPFNGAGEVRLRDGHIGPVHSSLRWGCEDCGTDIIAFRPAEALSAHPPATGSGEAVESLWQELLEVDDRTSPPEYPDMCLITYEEFADFIRRAAPVAGRGDRALIEQLRGRAAFCRSRGEVKTPDLLDRAILALSAPPSAAGVEALEWALDQAGAEHPHYPERSEDGGWQFPYLVHGSPMGGGVGHARYATALEAVRAAMTWPGSEDDAPSGQALASTAPQPMEMLVNQDWLRRRMEQDPDLDCEAGTAPQQQGDERLAVAIKALDTIRRLNEYNSPEREIAAEALRTLTGKKG